MTWKKKCYVTHTDIVARSNAYSGNVTRPVAHPRGVRQTLPMNDAMTQPSPPLHSIGHRPLSRRLDRCDRVIQDEVGDSNGGNV